MTFTKYKIRIKLDALRDLVPFMQFKKREKYTWRSVTFKLQTKTPSRVFLGFLNCTHGTKSLKASKMNSAVLSSLSSSFNYSTKDFIE